jgi:hypothetical protein
MLAFLIPLLGIGVGLFIYVRSRDEVDRARQAAANFTIPPFPSIDIPSFTVPPFSIPQVSVPPVDVPFSIPTVTTPGSVGTATTVGTGDATTVPVSAPSSPSFLSAEGIQPAIDAIAGAGGGDPARFVMLTLYPDHGLGQVVDPSDATSARNVFLKVGSASITPGNFPVTGDPATSTFTTADFDPATIATDLASTPSQLGDPSLQPAYVVVSRSAFLDGSPVTVHVYVQTAGGSRYAEFDAHGVFLKGL